MRCWTSQLGDAGLGTYWTWDVLILGDAGLGIRTGLGMRWTLNVLDFYMRYWTLEVMDLEGNGLWEIMNFGDIGRRSCTHRETCYLR